MPLSTTPEKLQQVNDEIGGQPNLASIPFIYIEGKKLKLRNIQISQNTISGSNSFILGHPVNGKLGIANGLGGGQIVFGQSGSNVVIELMKRSYEWKSKVDFEKGTVQNLDISQGFLQIGNITLKNMLLEHKTKW
mgnify:CR=1 FL=1